MSLEIKENLALARFSTWRVGGPAERFVEPKTEEEVLEAQALAKENNWAITVLGGGSNTLISDKGIKGLVVSTRKMVGIEEREDETTFYVTAKAGTPKLLVMRSFLRKNLTPSLFLSGIPGDVGGGVVMNAGVSEDVTPREFCEIVTQIKVAKNGQVHTLKNEDLDWTYRSSKGWQPGIITEVEMAFLNDPVSDMKERVKAAQDVRSSKQPLTQPSCGSVFVNPDGHKAAILIQESGLKGFSIGGAQVSEKHANFIINTGSATAQDIHDVMEHVQKTVEAKTGVRLHNEVRYLGEW